MSWYKKSQAQMDGYWILRSGEVHHCGFWGHGIYVFEHPELFEMEKVVRQLLDDGESANTVGDHIVNNAVRKGAIRVNITRVVDVLVRSKADFDDRYIEILKITKRHGLGEDKIFKHFIEH